MTSPADRPAVHPTTPPLLLAAGALFWGWQTGYYAAAIAIALLVEAPRWTRLRLELNETHYNRVADFTTWLLIGIAGYLVATRGLSRGVITTFQWLPALLMPIVAVQRFSRAERINLTALFRLLRRLKARGEPVRDPSVDLSWTFLAISLIAAGAANQRGPGYFAGMLVIVGWALWSVRPPDGSRSAWAALFVMACAIGYAGHLGVSQLQEAFESWVGDWLLEHSDPNPYRTTTRIGHVGELKLSGTIVARVHAKRGEPAPPPLLHRASYNLWSADTWVARGAPLAALTVEPDGKTWTLSSEQASERSTITARFEAGRSLIALPADTVRIADLAAISAARSRLGAVQIELEGGWIRYVAERAGNSNAHSMPAADDSQLPPAARELWIGVADQLGLRGIAPAEALARVRRHFTNFTYSVYRSAPAAPADALAEFVTRTRTGHCEYFAAATTLLLRAAGIPARYATGFAVMEYSALEDAWLVRQRHAHAWSRAWIGGRWLDVDTTPADWYPVETNTAPAWETVTDWLRWAGFRWSQRDAGQGSDDEWLWVAAVLVVVLAWRLARYRTSRNEGLAARVARADRPGRDSEFYALERSLAGRGWPRPEEESVGEWASRVAGSMPTAQRAALAEAARLHERYRFDPAGLPTAERARLRALCASIG